MAKLALHLQNLLPTRYKHADMFPCHAAPHIFYPVIQRTVGAVSRPELEIRLNTGGTRVSYSSKCITVNLHHTLCVQQVDEQWAIGDGQGNGPHDERIRVFYIESPLVPTPNLLSLVVIEQHGHALSVRICLKSIGSEMLQRSSSPTNKWLRSSWTP